MGVHRFKLITAINLLRSKCCRTMFKEVSILENSWQVQPLLCTAHAALYIYTLHTILYPLIKSPENSWNICGFLTRMSPSELAQVVSVATDFQHSTGSARHRVGSYYCDYFADIPGYASFAAQVISVSQGQQLTSAHNAHGSPR